MKKKLEAELISIAHRILKLKNKSDVEQLYHESRQLYEKLAILRFAEQNFTGARPTIGIKQIEEQVKSYTTSGNSSNTDTEVEANAPVETPAEGVAETVNAVASDDQPDHRPADIADETSPESIEVHPEAEPETAENMSEQDSGKAEDVESEETPGVDKQESAAEAAPGEETEVAPEAETAISDSGGHDSTNKPEVPEADKSEEPKKEEIIIPAFELTFEKKEDLKTDPAPERKQITFDDLLGPNYSDPVFEKVQKEAPKVEFDGAADGEKDNFTRTVESAPLDDSFPKGEYKPVASKDGPARTISFGLNDRIGFEKHLFGGSSEDMNRVVSQLSTFDTFEEANDFIEEMVKPDYNNWEGKEQYSKWFMEIIGQRFS